MLQILHSSNNPVSLDVGNILRLVKKVGGQVKASEIDHSSLAAAGVDMQTMAE